MRKIEGNKFPQIPRRRAKVFPKFKSNANIKEKLYGQLGQVGTDLGQGNFDQ